MSSEFIEMYDTELDQKTENGRDNISFTMISLKRGSINNVGNLICFPIYTPQGVESGDILITGGLFVGLTDVKSHTYNT